MSRASGDGPSFALTPAFYAGVAASAFLISVILAPEARAALAVADGVKSQLMSLGHAALGVGIAWFGYLVLMGRGSMQLIVTFLIGAAIVLRGGFLS